MSLISFQLLKLRHDVEPFQSFAFEIPNCPCHYIEVKRLAPSIGWVQVDKLWCTLLACNGYLELGHKWMVNPWDQHFHEYDIAGLAWDWISNIVKNDPVKARAVLAGKDAAKKQVETWRKEFFDNIDKLKVGEEVQADPGLKAPRFQSLIAEMDNSAFNLNLVCLRLTQYIKAFEDAEKAAAAPPKPTRYQRLRAALTPPATLGAAAASAKGWIVYWYKFVFWAIDMYMKAHMFFRHFLAKPTDAFSASERITMQSTGYFVSLVLTIWIFYEKGEACCLELRDALECSPNILEECNGVGGGCLQLMSQKDFKPKGWKCMAFPDKAMIYHFMTLMAINIGIMFPVKFTLTKVGVWWR